ncbi:MAG: cyclopropane-fatty-acyl-phospholipid synthase [Janthinobacterium sp.]|jgi:cyclopropane-fatty-acyl-phospholipid synthase
MSSKSLAATRPLETPASHASDRITPSGRLILKMLSALTHGALLLKAPDGSVRLFGDGSHPISLELKDWSMCAAALRSGDIGFAETFIAGQWKTDDLPGLIALLIRNRSTIETLIYGTWWGSLLYRAKHFLNRNSRSGSKKNIHAHYDIGNRFYQLWLDPSMSYSSALFSGVQDDNLMLAQQAKYRRILDQLDLAPGARVLEIGCGWGGFAEMAARDQVHVTGLTLSTEQLDYAQQRLLDAGLADLADLQLCDYRDSHGQYDAIASIEMFEAVGQSYWSSYFECVASNLKKGGRACIQTIVIADALFERYSKGTDFIQQYIFPGGMLPSPQEFRRCAAEHGLRVTDEFCFGLDYAHTLRLWRNSFTLELAAIERQGFDVHFLRTWEFYLCYCEAAFCTSNTDVMQFTLVKD